MLTSEPAVAAVPDSRPAYRPFRARVLRVTALSPHFSRVTFTGDDLATFGARGLDQRINLIFPIEGVGLSDCGWDDAQPLPDGHWYARWRGLPNELRNPLRTYTVGAMRPAERELDVDFVVHGDGPAARWLSTAATGDEVIVIGPDALSENSHIGIDWQPGDASSLLLVGDETAAPAIAGILAALPPGATAHAIIEIPDDADAAYLDGTSPGATVDWVARNGGAPGSALLPAVRARVGTESHADGFYAWVAGESGAVTSIRRYLVREAGVHRRQIAFMGYWRTGASQG